ncbi:MAG: hypothetical protein ACI8W8_000839 [Rhodothermales bacterium]|jgi:hypothetical protein
MNFASPFFLPLLALAATPLVFHFLMKRKRKQLEVPTFLFFYRTDPRLNARRKIRELLLLLMRVLLIAFVILALARPAVSFVRGLSGRVAIVIVVDNSGSMIGTSNERHSKLQMAIEGAQSLLTNLDAGSEAGVVTTVDDPALQLPETTSVDVTELGKVIDSIRDTQAEGDPAAALARAGAMLAAAAAGGELGLAIHVFTDLQAHEWDGPALPADLLGAEIEIVIHRVHSQPPTTANVSIASVALPNGRLLPKHQYQARVEFRNDGDKSVEIRVNSEDIDRNTSNQTLILDPRSSQTIPFDLNPQEPGARWLNVWLEGDGFFADNQAGIGYLCQDLSPVLFAGIEANFSLLPMAISPNGDGTDTYLQPVHCGIDELLGRLELDKPLLVVTTWKRLAELGDASVALRGFVETGGNLLVLPALHSVTEPVAPDWLGAKPAALVEGEDQLLAVLDRKSDLWGSLREGTGRVSIRYFAAKRYHPLTLSEDYAAILGESLEMPVLAERALGDGFIYVSGITWSPKWSSLVTDPTGAAMVLAHNMAVRDVDADASGSIALIAGERPPPLDTEAKEIEIMSLIGDAWSRKVAPSNLPVFPRAGVFVLKSEGKTERCVRVRASEFEGSDAYIEGSSVPALASLPHSVSDFSDESDFAEQLAAHRAGTALFLPLLLLAAIAWAAEGWLASATLKEAAPDSQ